MELTNEKVIHAPRARVYDALHDPQILRQVIPGLQLLNVVSDERYELTVALKVGPLKSTFQGTITVYNQDPPSGYSLRGTGSGSAGSADGHAHVALASIDPSTTNLAYHLTADLSGQLERLEDEMIRATARTMTAEFFSRLEQLLETADSAPGTIPVREAATIGPREGAKVSSAHGIARVVSAEGMGDNAPPPKKAQADTVTVLPARSDLSGPARDMTADMQGTRGGAEVYKLPAHVPADYARPAAFDFEQSTVTNREDANQRQVGAAFGAVADEPISARTIIWRIAMIALGIFIIVALLSDRI